MNTMKYYSIGMSDIDGLVTRSKYFSDILKAPSIFAFISNYSLYIGK